MTEELREQAGVPAGFRVREARPQDAAAVTALVAASQEELHGEAEISKASVLAKWQRPRFDLSQDAWLVEAADAGSGAAGPPNAPLVAGFAAVHQRGPAEFDGNLIVHPQFWGRGLGAALLSRIEERVRKALARSEGQKGVLHTWSSSADTRRIELCLASGFERVAAFARMRKDLTGDLQQPHWPPGIEPRPFRRGQDDLAVFTALVEAFGEDEDDLPDPERWSCEVVNDPRAEPALWLLACEGEHVAGVVICSFVRGRGVVERLAVRPAWQDRGIGGALLYAAFQLLRRRGATEVVLAVQLGVAHEALDLYVRAGMTEVRRIEFFEKGIVTGLR